MNRCDDEVEWIIVRCMDYLKDDVDSHLQKIDYLLSLKVVLNRSAPSEFRIRIPRSKVAETIERLAKVHGVVEVAWECSGVEDTAEGDRTE